MNLFECAFYLDLPSINAPAALGLAMTHTGCPTLPKVGIGAKVCKAAERLLAWACKEIEGAKSILDIKTKIG